MGVQGFSSTSGQPALQFEWNGDVLPIERLDLSTFIVVSSDLAQRAATNSSGTVYQAKISRADNAVDVQFRVRGTTGNAALCAFFDLTISARDKLAAILSQASLPSKSTLQALSYDEIANGDSAKEEKPLATPKAASATKKAAFVTLLVGSLAMIAGWISYLAVSRTSISVSNGVMAGNYQAINTPLDGELKDVRVSVGARVDQGQVLATVVNPEATQNLKQLEVKLQRAKRDLTTYESQAEAERLTLEYAKLTLATQHKVAVADRAGARGQLAAAQSRIHRLEKLRKSGLIRHADYEDAQAAASRWSAEIDKQDAIIESISIAKDAAKNEVIVRDNRIINPVAEVRTKISVARATIEELQATRALMLAAAKPIELLAPTSGIVYAVYRQPGENLKRADQAVAISRDGNGWATGQVSSSDAANIKPGQVVEIEIPSYGTITTGVVQGVGSRAVYGRDGYSPDFRGAPTDVPIRVAFDGLDKPIPAGLRLNMTIRLHDYIKDLRNWIDAIRTEIAGLFPSSSRVAAMSTGPTEVARASYKEASAN